MIVISITQYCSDELWKMYLLWEVLINVAMSNRLSGDFAKHSTFKQLCLLRVMFSFLS
jgi:hypothetical protein